MKYNGKLILTDMDATLLTDDKRISEKNLKAIEYFIENGGFFSIASGRAVEAAREFFPPLKINAPAVLYNGAMIYDFANEKIIYESFIEEERKAAIKSFYEDYPDAGIEIYSEGRAYIYRSCFETARFEKRKNGEIFEMSDEVWSKPWTKVLIIGTEEYLDRIEPIYRGRYDKGYSARSGPHFLDIVAGGASKGTGAERLASALGIEKDNVYAVGDNMNDISMIEWAGFGCAVGNAADKIKENADIVLPDNNHDALSYLIEHII